MKQSLLPKTDGVKIAISIKDGEGITMEQDAGSIICERRLSPDIELILDLNYVRPGCLWECHSQEKLRNSVAEEHLPAGDRLITGSTRKTPKLLG